MQETTPPGFEHVVRALKGKPGISPYAIAWAMKNKGIHPKKENGEPYDPEALYRRYQHECQLDEALSISSMGQLVRSGMAEAPFGTNQQSIFSKSESMCPSCQQKREAAIPQTGQVGWVTPFREAVATTSGTAVDTPRVVLITAGPGNIKDRNFYPPDIIARDCKIFEGKPCFFDHIGEIESENRMEREVELIGAYFRNVLSEVIDGNVAATADLVYLRDLSGELTTSGKKMKELAEAAINYNRDFPGTTNQLLGFSINAAGGSEPIQSESLASRYPLYGDTLREAHEWNAVTDISKATSTDMVTFPARGGRVLGLRGQRESQRWRVRLKGALNRLEWRKRFEQTFPAHPA